MEPVMPYTLIRIPKRFLDDHLERDLPTPEIVRETSLHYFIASGDPAIGELIEDARHYADGLDEAPRGIVMSARATLRAIRQAEDR
jgi:hypothetical protein